MTGDINVYSPLQNLHYHRWQNAVILKELIEQYGFLINSKLEQLTRLISRNVLMIDLALSITKLGPLTLQEILKEYLSSSNHELIALRQEDIDYDLAKLGMGEITSQDIQGLLNNKMSFEVA